MNWSLTFNPTMVWFYQSLNPLRQTVPPLLSIPLWSDFITGKRRTSSKKSSTFNPTMVWFYQLFRQDKHYFLSTFNPTMVWFYQPLPTRTSMNTTPLSIPLWSDFISVKEYLECINNVALSIPLWSDFIQVFSEIGSEITQLFQSHYGLILSWKQLTNTFR